MPSVAEPFHCSRCGDFVDPANDSRKPNVKQRLCGRCKVAARDAKRGGMTLAEYDAKHRKVIGTPQDFICATCRRQWTAPTRTPAKECPDCSGVYRRSRARRQGTAVKVGTELTCPRCSASFTKSTANQKYCSKRCAKAAEDPGHEKRVLARCAWCDHAVQQAASNAKAGMTPVCSKNCQAALFSMRRAGSMTQQCAAYCVKCGGWFATKSAAKCPTCRGQRDAKLRPRFTAGRCRRCGDSFVLDKQQFMAFGNYCSPRCGKRAGRERRRIRKRKAYVADVWRADIFKRDKFMCQICGKRLAMKQSVPHPKAPTIDHILPIAMGGKHDPANCQSAHFICNATKSNGTAPGGDQLLLVG